ncbi:MAG: GtrA family protein, partial [Firmicutes bacterium]|nr:GtrA family protein [Bacillota bacterium]
MKNENFVQLVKFALVGCVNTLVDWAVYFAVIRLFPAESAFFYASAKGFSYFCGIVNSFFLNRCWTFKAANVGGEGGRFFKFVLVNAVGLTVIGIPSFIMTLAMMQIGAGICALLVRGQIAYAVPDFVATMGAGRIGPVPWIVIVLAVFLPVVALAVV